MRPLIADLQNKSAIVKSKKVKASILETEISCHLLLRHPEAVHWETNDQTPCYFYLFFNFLGRKCSDFYHY